MPDRDLFVSRLTAFKERLLDLSGRNRMIHSNFQARSRLHFRFIDEVPNQLFEKLTSSKMDFVPLPEPEETPKDEESSEFKSALEIAMLSNEDYLTSTQGIETNESDNLNQDSEAALRVLKNKVRNDLGMTQIQEEGFSIEAHARTHGFNPNYELPLSTDEGVIAMRGPVAGAAAASAAAARARPPTTRGASRCPRCGARCSRASSRSCCSACCCRTRRCPRATSAASRTTSCSLSTATSPCTARPSSRGRASRATPATAPSSSVSEAVVWSVVLAIT